MKKIQAMWYIALFMSTGWASAGTGEWTSGWGQGNTEYLVSDGKGIEMNITCPDDEGAVSAYISVNGKSISAGPSGSEGFDVIVNGEKWQNPFNTDCRVCADNFEPFWEALRKAKTLAVVVKGKEVPVPTKKIGFALPKFSSKKNSCRVAF